MTPERPTRIQSIDALRGIVMIIMALDHVREFLHSAAFSFRAEDMSRTTPAIFLTRWITHFCAPVFMFTAGLGAYFWMRRGRTIAETSRYLVVRGLWLILLELTLVRFFYQFNFDYSVLILSILWALGWCMIALGALVYLPVPVTATISILMIAGHDLLDGIQAASFGGSAWVWNIAHQQGVFNAGKMVVISGYPLIPWIGVMAAGWCFGRFYEMDAEKRKTLMMRLGLTMATLFLALRAINIYGDPFKWTATRLPALSFLNTSKYPPSLDFLLMTLGPALVVLAWLEGKKFARQNPLMVFGRTPLFYFAGHLFIIHVIVILMSLARYGDAGPVMNLFGPREALPKGYGYDLWVVYAIWVITVAVMYPFSRWWGGLQAARANRASQAQPTSQRPPYESPPPARIGRLQSFAGN